MPGGNIKPVPEETSGTGFIFAEERPGPKASSGAYCESDFGSVKKRFCRQTA
jgi:hypothetical protein